MPIFFSLKGSAVLIKIMKEKMAVTLLVFATELHMHFLRLLREDWDVFQNGMYVEGERRH